jgi:2-dehydro-3-deoxygalactonokinase
MNKSNNYSYLSGLLIGAELQHLQTAGASRIILVCGAGLHDLYRDALEELGLHKKTTFLPAGRSEEAVIQGQYKILKSVTPYAG